MQETLRRVTLHVMEEIPRLYDRSKLGRKPAPKDRRDYAARVLGEDGYVESRTNVSLALPALALITAAHIAHNVMSPCIEYTTGLCDLLWTMHSCIEASLDAVSNLICRA